MHRESAIDVHDPSSASVPAPVAERIRSLERLATARQEQLDRKASELQALVAASPAAIVLTDDKDRIREWNPAAERMLGFSRRQVLERAPEMFIDHSRRRELDKKLDRGETFTGVELRMHTKDHRRIYVSASGAPVYDGNGALSGHMWVLLDITERKRAEETLRKSEKLASAGRMAAVIAHEINNPLEAITNLLYLLGTENLSDQARNFLQLADSELKRVVHIARQTLGFYRESNKPQQIQLADVFQQVAEIYAPKMRKRHTVLRHEFSSPGEILAYPGEIRQLLTNLISNAIEADATEMRVGISSYREWKAPYRWGSLLTFMDNGKGISREGLQHIFEPFYTTKGEKGTGLGLWVSRGIIHKYEGAMRVRSSDSGPRRGTTFSIFFPSPAAKVVPINMHNGREHSHQKNRRVA
jgi:PAS domain S-box-containing protein